jgi:uncharacterized membrane protein YfcA
MQGIPLWLGLSATGTALGILSAWLGIGGGVLVVPILVLLFDFAYKEAVGTSLAMLLPPVGLFAVMAYWKQGLVQFKPAMVLALTFSIGAWIGAIIISRGYISDNWLKRIFSGVLVYVAGRLFIMTI